MALGIKDGLLGIRSPARMPVVLRRTAEITTQRWLASGTGTTIAGPLGRAQRTLQTTPAECLLPTTFWLRA